MTRRGFLLLVGLMNLKLQLKRMKKLERKLQRATKVAGLVKYDIEQEIYNEMPLEIREDEFFYKGRPITLIGASEWNILARATNLINDPEHPVKYDKYMNLMKSYGINYVRHGIIPDLIMVHNHCSELKKFGIIVELTIHNSQSVYDMGKARDAVDATLELGNVFYDVHNEFTDTEEDIKIAHDLIDYVRSKGGIASAGAYGWSTHGKDYSDKFDPIRSGNQIISVHRE